MNILLIKVIKEIYYKLIKFYYPYNDNDKSLLDLEFYIYSNKKGDFYTLNNLNYGYNALKNW